MSCYSSAAYENSFLFDSQDDLPVWGIILKLHRQDHPLRPAGLRRGDGKAQHHRAVIFCMEGPL